MEKLFTSPETTKNYSFSFKKKWGYEVALKEQLLVFESVADAKQESKILSGEHLPVYTMGNSLSETPSSASEIPFVKTDRGGQLMYHGPGQLTLYPIFKLKEHFSGPREYSKYIFDTAIAFFKKHHNLDLKCMRNGLWLNERKVGFLGLRIKKGITYHGLSLNYCADLNAFKAHSPCDISGEQAGNLFDQPHFKTLDLEFEAGELSKALVQKLTI